MMKGRGYPRSGTALIAVAILVLIAGCGGSPKADAEGKAGAVGTVASSAPAALPRLVDLGRGTCIPCKQMAPILAELQKTYSGRASVEVIDLRDSPAEADRYGIRLIPTQIFFDASGKEVWRHEGFLPREDIVAKFRELGVKDS